MAITGVDRLFWLSLRDDGLLPERPRVLEIGQANWYGDASPAVIPGDVEKYAAPGQVASLQAELHGGTDAFGMADVFYRAVLQYRDIVAIDLNGRERSIPHDLNRPLPPEMLGRYGITINTGTTEHVFDQRQLWESIHDATTPDGLMVHFLPLWGWLDHGFYNYHPTFVADLGAVNGYEVVKWWVNDLTHRRYFTVGKIGDIHAYARRDMTGSTMMLVALRKKGTEPFRVPQQGYYQGTLSPELAADWRSMR